MVDRENGTLKFLTKGDNNQVDDRGLYAPGQMWLEKKDVVGRAKGSGSSIYILTPRYSQFCKPKSRVYIQVKLEGGIRVTTMS